MVLMLLNQQELDELAQLLPYQVHCDTDPAELTFPLFIKVVMIQALNEAGEHEDVLLLVTMTQQQIDAQVDKLERRIRERLLNGYEYAEAHEGAGDADSHETTNTDEYTSEDLI